MAQMNATVYLACRDQPRCDETIRDIQEAVPGAKLHGGSLDLASLASVRKYAKEFLAQEQKLHVLINNAGVMFTPYWKTEDGFEMQIGVNHLGHYLLTRLLLSALQRAAPSRIVHVSSRAHRIAPVVLDSWVYQENKADAYSSYISYGQSKRANILFSNVLQAKLYGTGITSTSSHPGVIMTRLTRYMGISDYLFLVARPFTWYFTKSEAQGAQTSLYQAVSPELEGIGGVYLEDCKVVTPASTDVFNMTFGDEFWNYSAKLVGLDADIKSDFK